MAEPELLTQVVEGVGVLRLNRPAAINARTVAMMRGMREALESWRDDEGVDSVLLLGEGSRGLCAGADVRALRQAVLDGRDFGEFFDLEYGLDLLIKEYPKPYEARQHGITMGGGLGISAHGSRRLASADAAFAMPETIIGFTPDVGVTWYLAHAPGWTGMHVALTGATVGARDGVLLGLADEADEAAPAGELEDNRSWIDACYCFPDPSDVIAALESHADSRARAAAALIRARSPLSVAVTLEAMRRVPTMTGVADVLAQDRVLADHMIGSPDFIEGVRAQLVDKDRTPRWSHDRIEDVTRAEVLACFRTEEPSSLTF